MTLWLVYLLDGLFFISEVDDETKEGSCKACQQETVYCCCHDIVCHFKELNTYLKSLGLLEFIASPSVAAVVYDQVSTSFIWRSNSAMLM